MRALAFLVVAACGTSPPPAASPAPSSEPAGCEVRFAARVAPAAGAGDALLTVSVENLGAASVELALENRCPAGPIDVTGLPDGYDVYSTCNMGACAEAPPIRVALQPGERRDLASASLRQGGPCQQVLPVGSYVITPVVPAGVAMACVEAATLTIEEPRSPAEEPRRAPTPPSSPPARPPSSPPARPPSSPPAGDPHACTTDADCEIYCPDVPKCCGNPCGCRTAINRTRRDAYKAHVAATCDRPPCQAMGCAYDPAYGAACQNNRCVPRDGIGP